MVPGVSERMGNPGWVWETEYSFHRQRLGGGRGGGESSDGEARVGLGRPAGAGVRWAGAESGEGGRGPSVLGLGEGGASVCAQMLGLV